MIKADQPKIFKTGVIAALSSVEDDNMSFNLGDSDEIVIENRRRFLSKNMIAMQSTVLCRVTFDREDYTQYTVVRNKERGHGMIAGTDAIIADALATDDRSVALFLPLADCIGAIFYDPGREPRLMLAHLGRHSTEQHGAEACVAYMKDKFGSKPENLLVWLSPSPNGTEYPLWKRDNKSLRQAVEEDLTRAGIKTEHIESSDTDTVTDENYFSHSEFLKGNRETDGRYAIVAKLR